MGGGRQESGMGNELLERFLKSSPPPWPPRSPRRTPHTPHPRRPMESWGSRRPRHTPSPSLPQMMPLAHSGPGVSLSDDSANPALPFGQSAVALVAIATALAPFLAAALTAAVVTAAKPPLTARPPWAARTLPPGLSPALPPACSLSNGGEITIPRFPGVMG